MAQLDDLYTALKNADAAGDKEGAQKLAAYIKTMPSAGSPAQLNPVAPAPAAPAAPSLMDRLKSAMGSPSDAVDGIKNFVGKNAVVSTLEHAANVGATIMQPFQSGADKLSELVTGIKPQSTNAATRAGIKGGADEIGVDRNSLEYKNAGMLTDIAATAGVGGAFGGLARLFGAVPKVVNALTSAGFTTGESVAPSVMAKVGDMALRSGAGAVTGGASTALIDPSSAGTGALVGAAIPPAMKVAGTVLAPLGNVAGKVFRSATQTSTAAGASDIAKALDAATPEQRADLIARLRSAQTLVPGASPTVAQALQTPEASILQRVVHDSPGSASLRDKLVAQSAARSAALEEVAPTNATGFAEAREDLGKTISRYATKADATARAKTKALYEAVPQDEAALYLPDLAPIRDKYFGAGSFTPRAGADKAVSTAQEIGSQAVPAIQATSAGATPTTLAQAVRRAGGLSAGKANGLEGEVADMRGFQNNLVRRNGGLTPDAMAQRMHEAGYIGDESGDTLLQALKSDSGATPQFSAADDLSQRYRALADASMGDAPIADTAAKKVTLREFDNLRKSIGATQRAAGRDPERAAEAAALGDMKKALDDRVNQVVAGDGAHDEVLPIAWADALDAARKSKVDQVQQFRTGPQAQIFRTGPDGQPALKGDEIASQFWGHRPGLADDVKSFKRLVGENPGLMGQFKSMVTTHGAATAEAGGKLTSKFSKWVDQTLPGLRGAFSPDEVKSLQRIAEDIDRSIKATKLGTSPGGSNTYQNAANALNLGLLGSPALDRAAHAIPGVRSVAGLGLDWARNRALTAKSTRMSNLLSDSSTAADAMEELARSNARSPAGTLADVLMPSIYRGAPRTVNARGNQ